MVMSFIDHTCKELGIEPICRELAVAPSSYHEHAARLANPAKRSARARRDDEIKQQIRCVHEEPIYDILFFSSRNTTTYCELWRTVGGIELDCALRQSVRELAANLIDEIVW